MVRISTSPAADGPVRATGVVWRDGDGAEHELAADVVVSAADLHHTETAPGPVWRRSQYRCG